MIAEWYVVGAGQIGYWGKVEPWDGMGARVNVAIGVGMAVAVVGSGSVGFLKAHTLAWVSVYIGMPLAQWR